MLTGTATDLARSDVDSESVSELIATACQVLAATGLAPDILGHVSVRVSTDAFVRCRGPRESGLAFTTADDVHRVPLDGTVDAQDLGAWTVPNELPIHTSVLRARPDVTAVVHAHPRAVVAMSLAGFPWHPIVGAFDIPAARITAAGVPTWSRAALVNTDELGDEVAAVLGERPVAVLHGHGLVSVGHGPPERAVAEAVTNAVAIDSIARLTLDVRACGVEPAPITDADLAQLPDLGAGFTVETMWRHLVRRTATAVRPERC